MPTGWRYKPDDEPAPRCPQCGCNEARVVSRPAADAAMPTGQAVCTHCGQRFRFAAEEAQAAEAASPAEEIPYRVVRARLRCPRCRSTEFRTDTTRAEQPDKSLLRYHVCSRCNYRFSSLER